MRRLAEALVILPGWESPPQFEVAQGVRITPQRRCKGKVQRKPRAKPTGRPRAILAAPQATYGKWKVIREVPSDRRTSHHAPQRQLLCECVCGIQRVVRLSNLECGVSESCGNKCRVHIGRHDQQIAAMKAAGQSNVAVSRELGLDRKTVARAIRRISLLT